MIILFYVLLCAYGLSMSVSSLVLFREKVLPLWLSCLNCLGAFILFLTPFSIVFLTIGLCMLFLTAMLNGFQLNGFPNWNHLSARLLFSICLILLYCFLKK